MCRARAGERAVVKLRVCRANPCARKAVFEGGDGEKEPGGRDGTGQGDRGKGKGKGTSNNQLPLHCYSRSLSLPFPSLWNIGRAKAGAARAGARD